MFYYYGSSKVDEIENPFKPWGWCAFQGSFPMSSFFSHFVSGWNPFYDQWIPYLNKEATHPVGKCVWGSENERSADHDDVTGSGKWLVFKYYEKTLVMWTEGESECVDICHLELLNYFY